MRHTFVSGVAHDEAQRVSSNDWNADHDAPPTLIWTMHGRGDADSTWIVPIVRTEFKGVVWLRTNVVLTGAKEMRFVAHVITPGAGELGWQYSPDGIVAFASLDGAGGPKVNVNLAGWIDSGWRPLVAGAKVQTYLRLTGVSGNGVASVKLGALALMVR